MDYAKIGNAGLLTSPVCLGAMSCGGPGSHRPRALPEAQGRPFNRQALGSNFCDTSESCTERVPGQALRAPARRATCLLATE
jgi:aryl-alcohol dehydrogenase-like predicted oxidoreductase